MITIHDVKGREILLAPTAIARVTDAGANWHRIGSYIKCFDGVTIECQHRPAEINRLINEARAAERGAE